MTLVCLGHHICCMHNTGSIYQFVSGSHQYKLAVPSRNHVTHHEILISIPRTYMYVAHHHYKTHGNLAAKCL